MVTLEAVATEILTRAIQQIGMGELSTDECAIVQTICHEQRDNPALAELIGKYTMLADNETGGVFSATLESQRNIMQ